MNISQIFSQKLGRQPTQEEEEYFGGMIDRGELSPVEFSYFMGTGQEEAQQGLQQLSTAGQQMTAAKAYETAMFPRYASQVQSQYAKMGRQSTSALDVAMVQKMSELALQRTQQFASLMGQQGAGNVQYGREKATTGRAQVYQTGAATTAYERQRQINADQYSYQRELAELNRKWQKEDTPSFLESLAPSLISAGSGIYGSYLMGNSKKSDYSDWY